MLYNICYWWFFLSQRNRWTKYLAYPKTRKPKPCLLMFASLVALDGFHLMLSTQMTTDLTQKGRGRSMFHLFSHIYAKLLFAALNNCKQRSESSMSYCFWSTVSKRGIHFEIIFLICKCSCKMVNTLSSDIFDSSAILHNFNLR